MHDDMHFADGFHNVTNEYRKFVVFTHHNENGWFASFWLFGNVVTSTIGCKDEYAAIRLLMNENDFINVVISNT